jgi:hypothetical protein
MQKLVLYNFLICFLFLSVSCENETDVIQLKLVKALPIEYRKPVEPSGLVNYGGNFYTVSDDHDDIIFKLIFHNNKITLEPHLRIVVPDYDVSQKMDFEGIDCDSDGNFYLASEEHYRVLFVSKDGAQIYWKSPSLRSYGEGKGLFVIKNANLEGITLVRDNLIALVAEREPRGLIELDLKDNAPRVHVFNLNKSRMKMPKNRPPDFSGMYSENGNIYVLQRALHCVSQLVEDGKTFKEANFWSFENTENNPKYAYSDTRYGLAEGLFMDEKYVYIILDNDGDYRAANPKDMRPLFFIFERPN